MFFEGDFKKRIQRVKKFQLKEFLEICTNCSSKSLDHASRLFINNYKNYIYKIVYKRCSSWYQEQLPPEFSEIVNDIVNDVFFLLFKNDAKALRQFKAKHSEKAFRVYLATISDRMAKRTLQKKSCHAALNELPEIKDEGFSQNTRWQIYDYIVAILRLRAGKQERFIERNILLFNMYTMEDFTKDMLQAAPVFHNLGYRVVDNVVGRSREKLTKDDENNLREILQE
jgi:hypothetical protein